VKTTDTPRSLQSRLLLLVLGLATAVWLAAAVLTWKDVRHELDELLDAHLAQAAALLTVQADGDDDDIRDAPVLHKYAPQVAFQVFINGQLITRSPNVGTTPMTDLVSGFSTIRQEDGSVWRVFSTYLPETEVRVYVGEKTQSRESILWAVMRSMLSPFVFALPLLAVACWWAVRKGLAPVRQFSDVLGKRPAHALEPVVLADMPPELRPLVDGLNALLQRIAAMMVSERRFTADAAHELRTPIAAIRAQAQVAMGATDDADQRNHALQSTLAGCDRATRLVEQLLTLARLEAAPQAAGVQTDLAAVARRVAGDLAPGALARAQVLELDAQAGCLVNADEVLLGVLVRNLLDNALRYSPDHAKVVVTIERQQGGVQLAVHDSGPGMSDDAIQRLGERFFRVLGSEQPGSGLGWSIVCRLVEVFGARAHVARSPDLGGLAVTVLWPS